MTKPENRAGTAGKITAIIIVTLILLLGCAGDSDARISGVWRVDLEASNRIHKLPADLEKDLKDLKVIINTQLNIMFLHWEDGSMEEHEFKITSSKKDFYQLKLAGRYDVELRLQDENRLLMVERENSLIFFRVDTGKK